jgi:hypothetical protein
LSAYSPWSTPEVSAGVSSAPAIDPLAGLGGQMPGYGQSQGGYGAQSQGLGGQYQGLGGQSQYGRYNQAQGYGAQSQGFGSQYQGLGGYGQYQGYGGQAQTFADYGMQAQSPYGERFFFHY